MLEEDGTVRDEESGDTEPSRAGLQKSPWGSFCPKCGSPLSDDAYFCPNCGQAVVGTGRFADQPLAGLTVPYPEGLSRLLLFLKWLLVIPAYVVLLAYGIVVAVTTFMSFWAILFTRRYPRGLFHLAQEYLALYTRTTAYYPLLLTDRYPLRNSQSEQTVQYQVEYPEQLSRRLLLLKLLSYVLNVVGVLVAVATLFLVLAAILAWFGILILGRYPKGLFNFVVSVAQWIARAETWQYLMRDEWSLFAERRRTGVALGASAAAAGALVLIATGTLTLSGGLTVSGGLSEAEAESNHCLDLAQQQKNEEALARCNRAIELDPELGVAYVNRALAEGNLGRFGDERVDAGKAIELLRDDNEHLAFAYVDRADAQGNLGNYDQAIGDATKAIELAPRDVTVLAAAYANRANAQSNLGKFDEAEKDATKAIELAPKDVNVLALAYANRANAQNNLGSFDEAARDVSKAIDLAPKDVHALALTYVISANVKANLGNFANAADDASKAIELAPRDVAVLAAAYANRAHAQISLGHFDEAVDDATNAIGLAPRATDILAGAYNQRAFAEGSLGNFEKAVDDASKTIGLAPKDARYLADAYFIRASAYAALQRIDKAEPDAKEACNLGVAPACSFTPGQ